MNSLSHDEKFVSVAIPTYNGADYLQKTIENVISIACVKQIVISDHESTDGTLEIARSFAQSDSRIQISSVSRDQPIWSNWLNALQICSSRYVKLIGQDDLVNENQVECELRALSGHSARNVSCVASRPLVLVGTRSVRRRDYFRPLTRVTAKTLETAFLRSGTNPIGEPVGLMIDSQSQGWNLLMNSEISDSYTIDLQILRVLVQHEDLLYLAGPKGHFRVSKTSWTSRSLLLNRRQVLDYADQQVPNLGMLRRIRLRTLVTLRAVSRPIATLRLRTVKSSTIPALIKETKD